MQPAVFRLLIDTLLRMPLLKQSLFVVLLLSLVGCGSGILPADEQATTFTIGGDVNGLQGSGLALQNNGMDTLLITSNGTFSFVTALESGQGYSVSVSQQPSSPQQVCTVQNGSGSIGTTSVANIQVSCLDPLPSAPVVTMSYGERQLNFLWSTVAGATYYRVMRNIDGGSGYTQVGTNVDALLNGFSLPISVHQLDWQNGLYLVEACNDAGCSASSSVSVLDGMLSTIAYVKSSAPSDQAYFGHAVSVSDDGQTMAVGAFGEAATTGAVYIYQHGALGWTFTDRLTASNANQGDGFGNAVALSGDGNTLVVGAFLESGGATGIGGYELDNSQFQAGAAYIFVRGLNAWTQQEYLKAFNTEASDNFAYSIAISNDGNTVAAGAPYEDGDGFTLPEGQDNNATDAGAVYLFRRDTTVSPVVWSQHSYIKASDAAAGYQFGYAISLSGDGLTLAAGSYQAKNPAISTFNDTGAAYLFAFDGTVWNEQRILYADNGLQWDHFSSSLSLDDTGSTLAVGAEGKDALAGAAYLFANDSMGWSQVAYLQASNAELSDQFGFAIALSGDGRSLAVGAFGEKGAATGVGGDQTSNANNQAGAVYLFQPDALNVWQQSNYIKASDTSTTDTLGDWFGRSVALNGDGSLLVIGAPQEDSGNSSPADNTWFDSGAVYLY